MTPESVVGLCLEQWPSRVIGLLSVLKAGGAYLPLDPDHPAERLVGMLRDSRASLLLTEDNLRDRLTASSVPVLTLDDPRKSLGQEDPGNPSVLCEPRESRLCHLHLGHYRATQGRDGPPQCSPRRCRRLGVGLQSPPASAPAPSGRGIQLRCLHRRLGPRPDDRRHSCRLPASGPARPGSAGRSHQARTHRVPGAGSGSRRRPCGPPRAAGRGPRRRPAAGRGLGHRALAAVPAAWPAGGSRRPRGQLLRSDRDDDRQHLLWRAVREQRE